MNQFGNLCDEFNIEPTPDAKVVNELTPKAVQELRKERQEEDGQKVVDYKGQKYTLKHLKLLETLWQEKIAADGNVLETLRQMCKVGAAPRAFEVYSSLSNTQAAHIKELSLLNKVITDYQVQESKEKIAHENMDQKERLIALRADQATGGDVYNIQNNNLTVTSSQLLDMIEQADKTAHAVEDNINPEFNLE